MIIKITEFKCMLCGFITTKHIDKCPTCSGTTLNTFIKVLK